MTYDQYMDIILKCCVNQRIVKEFNILQSSTSGFITSVEQAKQFWNDWSPWTVTVEVFELTTEAQVDAFLKIAEKNKL